MWFSRRGHSNSRSTKAREDIRCTAHGESQGLLVSEFIYSEQRRRWIGRLFAVGLGCGFALLGSPPARAANGGELFLKHCASRHGKDGKAQTHVARKLGVKDLTQSKLADVRKGEDQE